MPDSQSADNAQDPNIKASVKHTKSGDVVNVQSADRHFDAAGETLKEQGHTVPMVAVPGKFPNGRSTPTSPEVQKSETTRQDAELIAAQKEVEQLKQILAQLQQQQQAVTQETPKVKPKPLYTPKYKYGDGTGDVAGSGGF